VGAALETENQARRSLSRPGLRVAVVALAGAAVLGVAIGVVLHFLLTGNARPAARVAGLEGQATWPAGQIPAPDFTLRDQSGQPVSIAGQRGRTIVLAFMDSRCHQVCPLEGRVLARAISTLPSRTRPVLLVVSVDPWADTRSSALAAGKHWGFTSDWHWLFGTQAQLAKVWHSYRIYVKQTVGDIVHSDAIYVIDQQGFERAGFLFPFLPGPVQRDLTKLASDSHA
jgi:cytochrome oxidase Cu insertion factor (SCO1/SenC/PrrC family)